MCLSSIVNAIMTARTVSPKNVKRDNQVVFTAGEQRQELPHKRVKTQYNDLGDNNADKHMGE